MSPSPKRQTYLTGSRWAALFVSSGFSYLLAVCYGWEAGRAEEAGGQTKHYGDCRPNPSCQHHFIEESGHLKMLQGSNPDLDHSTGDPGELVSSHTIPHQGGQDLCHLQSF